MTISQRFADQNRQLTCKNHNTINTNILSVLTCYMYCYVKWPILIRNSNKEW